jgi:ElaB/YqjD/DUF883 family membrane-anchored ribosome-binding protein
MNQMSTTRSREAIEKVEDGIRQARAQLRRTDQQIVRFAKEKPLLAVFSALAAGFVLGRIISRL